MAKRATRNMGFDLIEIGQLFTFSPYDGEEWRKTGKGTARLLKSRLPGAGKCYTVKNIYRAAWTLE